MKQRAPDWPEIIAGLVAAGMTAIEIGKHPSVGLSLRAVVYLQNRDRGQQPMYHRGEGILQLWCERTGQPRNEVPMCDVTRGHRKARVAVDLSPKLMELPVWPPVEQQGKKRRVKETA